MLCESFFSLSSLFTPSQSLVFFDRIPYLMPREMERREGNELMLLVLVLRLSGLVMSF